MGIAASTNTNVVTSPMNVGATNTVVGPNSQLDEGDFLMLLITQLSNQDPLKPLDDSEFIAQMAQLNTLSETIKVNENLQTVQMLQASSLVGHQVEAIGPYGEHVQGTVTQVWFIDSQPYLVIDNDIVVSLEYVVTVA